MLRSGRRDAPRCEVCWEDVGARPTSVTVILLEMTIIDIDEEAGRPCGKWSLPEDMTIIECRDDDLL